MHVCAGGNDFYWPCHEAGVCLHEVEHPDDAMDMLMRATLLKPDFALAYNEMGHRFGYWHDKGQPTRAKEFLTIATQLEPTSGVYWVNLGMALQHVGEVGVC